MKYTGIPCAACGKKFTAEDDVVVCPECGTPYHRACYKELGHCVNEARHAEGYVWQPPKAAPGPSVPLEEQPHAPQNKTDGEGYVMCSRCGTVNPAGQEHCDLCGYPLKETGERIPAGDRETEDGGTFAEYVRDQYNVNPNEKLGDELTAREVAAYVGPNALNFLYKFRAMLQRKPAGSFNLGAFLFTGLYCFYRKMYAQSKTMDEVFDLFAFRVIVDTVADCYNVLGVIHDLYRPVLGRFKDYIGTPKPNGYQSLHTTVMGPDGVMFEVQIRTQEMHDIAEYGSAAHWKYKQGISGSANEQNYEWVRRLLENQENTDAEEFIHTLKVDMFADEVFVFTPRGDVTNLPAGATPIDFAYSVHSAVGNSMIGAKVNNRIASYDAPLHNGDIVEIGRSVLNGRGRPTRVFQLLR